MSIEDLNLSPASERTALPETFIDPTTFEVSCFPLGHRNRRYFTITVEHRGGDLYGVFDGRMCLGSDGVWDFEPSPSGRDDDWLATHRFPLDVAMGLAEKAAPRMTVNGLTVAQAKANHPIN